MSPKRNVVITPRLPWEDRWHQPTFEQLLEPQKDQPKRVVPILMEKVLEFQGVSQRLVWHGAAWKWTIQFDLADDAGKDLGPLAYLVLNPEKPVFCMPLSAGMVERLPLKRLNKYIREGVREAKWAVEIHWCFWSPSAQTEVEYLTDLIKRVHKLMLTGAPSKQTA